MATWIDRREHCAVAEQDVLYGERTWFIDVRSPARRMAASNHWEQGLGVISLWQGESCTATFRLPLPDAARFVDGLTQGMSVKDSSAD